MYPNPVVAIPTPSTKTLSPTANGKSCPTEKSVSRVSSTVAVVVVNPTVSIPTPFELWIGIMVGLGSWSLLVFSSIITVETPTEPLTSVLISHSSRINPLTLSLTINLGGIE